MSVEAPQARYARYRALLADRRLPAACVDLDAFDRNVARLLEPIRAAGLQLRVPTKSLRCLALIERVLSRAGSTAVGLMTYTAAETLELARRGIAKDLLLAYPIARAVDADAVAQANALGATASVVVDCAAHLVCVAAAAERASVRVPVVIEVDVAWRPARDAVHVGVLRSPVRTTEAACALADAIARIASLRLHGVMTYEAQLAGVPDVGVGAGRALDAARAAMKARALDAVRRTRAELSSAFAARGVQLALFNGGGTGSVHSSARDASLTEVSVGSGFLDSHLFDRYHGLDLEPAAFFALEAVRAPGPGVVTCLGGGYVASGESGADRSPVPWLPAGLALRALEGAGEVQTPVRVPAGVKIALGDPVCFRHAKAGELAEHFNEYMLVRGDAVERVVPTYRGSGWAFLG